MPSTFSYKVRDNKGNLITGVLEGENMPGVVGRLREMGYTVVNVSEQTLAKKELKIPLLGGKVKAKQLTIFSRQFATMINAGLSLSKCLTILGEQTESPVLRKLIVEIHKDVEAGKALSEAMVKHSKVFSPLFINMVRAGETGGVLDEVLLRVAEHFEKEAAIRSKIKSAMSYPTVMFAISFLITFVLITFIVPIFVNMFGQLGGALPLPTQILLKISNAIRGSWFIFIPVIAGIFYGIKAIGKTEKGRLRLDAIKLKMPVFGNLSQKMSISRFSRTLGTLITSGVPILQALDIVAESSGNAVVSRSVKKARLSIKEGETISRPLSDEKTFPPMVVQMIAVGEETGALDTMLKKIADFYDEEVANTVESLTSLIEPLMMAGLGVVIGGIIISLYMPMFQVITLIK